MNNKLNIKSKFAQAFGGLNNQTLQKVKLRNLDHFEYPIDEDKEKEKQKIIESSMQKQKAAPGVGIGGIIKGLQQIAKINQYKKKIKNPMLKRGSRANWD